MTGNDQKSVWEHHLGVGTVIPEREAKTTSLKKASLEAGSGS